MDDIIKYLPAGGLLIVCICLIKMMNGRLQGKVSRKECHTAQKGIKDKIDVLDMNINRRFDDLKDFIKENNK